MLESVRNVTVLVKSWLFSFHKFVVLVVVSPFHMQRTVTQGYAYILARHRNVVFKNYCFATLQALSLPVVSDILQLRSCSLKAQANLWRGKIIGLTTSTTRGTSPSHCQKVTVTVTVTVGHGVFILGTHATGK